MVSLFQHKQLHSYLQATVRATKRCTTSLTCNSLLTVYMYYVVKTVRTHYYDYYYEMSNRLEIAKVQYQKTASQHGAVR